MDNFYKYKALVTRVVDGDTIDAQIDLGFNVHMNIRFRLEGYDAPESWRPKNEEERIAGNAATDSLKDMIENKEVIIHSNKFGKYRWLGTVYLPDSPVSINDQMINLGHIKP